MSVPVPQSESAFKRWLAAFGIGAAEFEIHVVGSPHPRGSAVEGIITARGGQVTQRLFQLTLLLRSFTEGDPSGTKVLATEVLAQNMSLIAQAVYTFPFRLQIPGDARLSRVVSGMNEGCRLVALASLQNALLPRQARAPLEITIHREIDAILSALRWMGFETEPWFPHHFSRPNQNDETTEFFRAPKSLQEQLTTLAVYLRHTGQHVNGKIVLDLRPHTLGSHMMGLVGGNKQHHSLQIPCDVLLSSNGQPNIYGALAYLKQVLSLALALPDDPKSWMLRPSMSPPADPETLLRPAMPTTSVASDDLLRPTAYPEKEP